MIFEIGPKTRAIVDAILPCVAKGTDPPPADGRGGRDRRRDPAPSRRSSHRRAVVGTAKAVLPGKGNDVWEMLVENVS